MKPQKSAVYTVRDVIAVLEAWAPPGLACEWDRVGLHVGTLDQPVSTVLSCLSVTREVLDAALKAGAEMIVAHHPLIWAPLKHLRGDDPHTRLCLDIAAAGIACFAAHTNLDMVPGGVNDLLADRLGLRERSVLIPAKEAAQVKLVTFVPEDHAPAVRDALAAAGAGVIGEYTHCSFATPGTGSFLPSAAAKPFSGTKGVVNEEPELRLEMLVLKARLAGVLAALRAAHPYEEPAFDLQLLQNTDARYGLGVQGELPKAMRLGDFAKQVCGALKCDHVRLVGDAKRKVRRIGVMGGAGGGEMAKLPKGIEVFVTGDVKYHDALDAIERGISIIDAGHCATEKGIAPVIAERLRVALPGLSVRPIIEREPFAAVLK